MAAEREIVDEAYAGDIIGVFDPGIFSIGDTITVAGQEVQVRRHPDLRARSTSPASAPEDTMKRKQFVKGTEQIAQEGAIQIFKVPNSGMEEVIVGVVGTLQFDVFQYRMKAEYGVDLRMEQLPYEQLRFITKAPVADLKDLYLSTDAELLEDYQRPEPAGLRLAVVDQLHPQAQPRPRAGGDRAVIGYNKRTHSRVSCYGHTAQFGKQIRREIFRQAKI